MTRKHYKKIAAILNEACILENEGAGSKQILDFIVYKLENTLYEDNSNFDTIKFERAVFTGEGL